MACGGGGGGGGGGAMFVARFVLPSGEQSVLQCSGDSTLADVKQLIWKKKAATDTHGKLGGVHDKVVRLALARNLHLPDQTTVAEAMHLFVVFRESNQPQQMPEFLLIPEADQADQLKRAIQQLSKGEPIAGQGYLLRQRNYSNKFKKVYCVLQSNTMFCFASQKAFQQGKSADSQYSVGAAVIENSSSMALEFRIRSEDATMESASPVFKSDNEHDRRLWLTAFCRANFRHSKWVIIRLCECLRARNALSIQGIFRLSGARDRVNALRAAFASGIDPDLSAYADEHVLADLVKITLRELSERLFAPHEAFSITSNNVELNLRKLQTSLHQMNPMHHGLAQYLMRFLHEVSTYSDVNLMTPQNLSIVFGPNVFEHQLDERQSCDFSRSNYAAELMITYYHRLFKEVDPSAYVRCIVKKDDRRTYIRSPSEHAVPLQSTMKTQHTRSSLPVHVEHSDSCALRKQSVSEDVKPANGDSLAAECLLSRSSNFSVQDGGISSSFSQESGPASDQELSQNLSKTANINAAEESQTEDFCLPNEGARQISLCELTSELNTIWREWNEQSPPLSGAIADSLTALEHEVADSSLSAADLGALKKFVDYEKTWRTQAMIAQERLYELLESLRSRNSCEYEQSQSQDD